MKITITLSLFLLLSMTLSANAHFDIESVNPGVGTLAGQTFAVTMTESRLHLSRTHVRSGDFRFHLDFTGMPDVTFAIGAPETGQHWLDANGVVAGAQYGYRRGFDMFGYHMTPMFDFVPLQFDLTGHMPRGSNDPVQVLGTVGLATPMVFHNEIIGDLIIESIYSRTVYDSPEPTSLVLLALGSAILLFRR